MAIQKSIPDIVERIIIDAMDKASDIHLEKNPEEVRVRYRIDGILYDQQPVPVHLANELFSRIKILAHLDIAQNRLPQDGKIAITIHAIPLDIRVATFPTLHGENIVLRILKTHDHIQTFAQLGISPSMEMLLKSIISKNTGFLIVTGPTGSGKTTTLYTILRTLNSPEKHIITIEDPVEYTIRGITQSPINTAIGFDFSDSVRCLLRQDPDIILIGEMRDHKTAAAAIEASLTGHLVLSTLHTKDACSTIFRLIDMQVERFLIAASLSGVLAQRLVRTICKSCKTTYTPSLAEQTILKSWNYGTRAIFKGAGCNACSHTGYSGRIGIFELLVIDDTLSTNIYNATVDQGTFKTVAYSHGHKPLIYDACEKIAAGITTVAEIMRVII